MAFFATSKFEMSGSSYRDDRPLNGEPPPPSPVDDDNGRYGMDAFDLSQSAPSTCLTWASKNFSLD